MESCLSSTHPLGYSGGSPFGSVASGFVLACGTITLRLGSSSPFSCMCHFRSAAGSRPNNHRCRSRSPLICLVFPSDVEETLWCRELHARRVKHIHDFEQQIFTQDKKLRQAAGHKKAMDLDVETALAKLDKVHTSNLRINFRLTSQEGASFLEHRAQLLGRGLAAQSNSGFKQALPP